MGSDEEKSSYNQLEPPVADRHSRELRIKVRRTLYHQYALRKRKSYNGDYCTSCTSVHTELYIRHAT